MSTKELHTVRRVMPKHMVNFDFVGVAPMVGPTQSIYNLRAEYNKNKETK